MICKSSPLTSGLWMGFWRWVSFCTFFLLNQSVSSCSLVAWCNSLRLHADKIVWGTIKTSPQEHRSGMSRLTTVVRAEDLHRWLCKMWASVFLPCVCCFGPELFVTPARLAQVQDFLCSSRGTRCWTPHSGWRIDLPTSTLSGCALFSVSSNSSKISLKHRGRATVKLTYSKQLLRKAAPRESATGFNPQSSSVTALGRERCLIWHFSERLLESPSIFFPFVTMNKTTGKPQRTVTTVKVSAG